MNIKYLNTDLDLKSNKDISPLIKGFGDKVYILHQQNVQNIYYASCEIDENVTDANSTAKYFCLLIEELPDNLREIWDLCDSKILNMGYESGTSPHSYRSELTTSTIRRIANLGMGIVVTIYPLPKNSNF